MTRNLRLLAVAWLLNVKQLTRSQCDGLLAILRFMERESRRRASLQIA